MSSQECQDKVSSSVCDFQIPTALAVLQPQILIFLLIFEPGSRLTELFSTTNLSCYWSQGILPCVSRSFSCCFWYKRLPAIPPYCHFSGKLCRLLTLSLGIYNSLSKNATRGNSVLSRSTGMNRQISDIGLGKYLGWQSVCQENIRI